MINMAESKTESTCDPVGTLDNPKIFLLELIKEALSNIESTYLGELSLDCDHHSASLIIDIKSGDELLSFLISTSKIDDVTDDYS